MTDDLRVLGWLTALTAASLSLWAVVLAPLAFLIWSL